MTPHFVNRKSFLQFILLFMGTWCIAFFTMGFSEWSFSDLNEICNPEIIWFNFFGSLAISLLILGALSEFVFHWDVFWKNNFNNHCLFGHHSVVVFSKISLLILTFVCLFYTGIFAPTSGSINYLQVAVVVGIFFLLGSAVVFQLIKTWRNRNDYVEISEKEIHIVDHQLGNWKFLLSNIEKVELLHEENIETPSILRLEFKNETSFELNLRELSLILQSAILVQEIETKIKFKNQ